MISAVVLPLVFIVLYVAMIKCGITCEVFNC